MNAKTTLAAVADRIASNLTPPERAQAVAASFRQLGEIGGELPLDLSDVKAALTIVGMLDPEDPEPVLNRRVTCRQISRLIGDGEDRNPDPRAYATVLNFLLGAFEGSTDPRQQAMRMTAERESGEIERFLKQKELEGTL